MSDHERGAYTPPTDAPLSFDARQPVRGARPMPFALILSALVLAGLALVMMMFYRSGIRHAGQPPQAVGAPVAAMKAPPPDEAQPQDPAAGLQIYKTEGGKAPSDAITPKFAPPPEQPQSRVTVPPPTPPVTVAQTAPVQAAPAPTLRPALPAAPPAAAPAPKVEAPKAAAPPAAKPVAVAKTEPPPAKAVPAKPEPAKAAKAAPAPAQAPAAKVAGVAAVQIGAVSSQALADKAWSEAAAVAPGLAAGKGKNVEKVDKDGKTLFRVQVTGFGGRAAATAFCDKLKAAGKACFVK
ncbi:SPOR domain-containing protein [Phenylobacterium sp.]|uniref:cell division protein FtsN n=1 Tax=Phenylobacterium sp. TaxID=1871053 RepID=UPI0011FFDB0B|nr:SPOR domain-containing protein [Phenylobacterium sp.]THD59433.1 MAG: SPOR domain-containing protein [Phenylobacterium sp.]